MDHVEHAFADVHPRLTAKHTQQGRDGQSEDEGNMRREVAIVEKLQRQKAKRQNDGQQRQRERWKVFIVHFVLVFVFLFTDTHTDSL